MENPVRFEDEGSSKTSWQRIMTEDMFKCFDDIPSCVCACAFPCCVAGTNQDYVGNGFCCSAFFYVVFAGCQRSYIQRALGVPDSGCLFNCCLHTFCYCSALAQETRAVNAWVVAGKPVATPGAISM